MDYNYDFSNLFATPTPFTLEANPTLMPQGGGAGGGDILSALQAVGARGGGGDQAAQFELLRNMMQQWAAQMEAQRAADAAAIAQTPRPQEYVQARRYAKDPYRAAMSDMDAARARGETPNIDAFKRINQIPELTPAAKIAVQGPSAMNQWARLGAYQGIDPAEVARMTVNTRFSQGNPYPGAQPYMPQGRYV